MESQWKRQVKHSSMQAQQTAPQHKDVVATESGRRRRPSVAAHNGHARRTRELHERGKKLPALFKASNSKVHAAVLACL